MIDKVKLHEALVDVESEYGSVLYAPNSAMEPIWKLTNRVSHPIYVSREDYERIAEYVGSQASVHPEPEYLIAKVLRHDPTWLRYRVQAYHEERLIPIKTKGKRNVKTTKA